MSVNEKMTAIADNIRSKTGKTELLNLDDMASGVNEVYEAGKEKEWSDFWDNFQNKGKRVNYHYAFGGEAWNEKTWKPKWDIKPYYAVEMFANCAIRDLEQAIKDANIVFDTSKVESMKSVITHLKDYSGTENAGKQTLTLKDTCKTLMAEQGEIEELDGKTYDAYIADIGWNLA